MTAKNKCPICKEKIRHLHNPKTNKGDGGECGCTDWVVRCPKSKRCKVFDLKELKINLHTKPPEIIKEKVLARGFAVVRDGEVEGWNMSMFSIFNDLRSAKLQLCNGDIREVVRVKVVEE